jgi:hypothetical protein
VEDTSIGQNVRQFPGTVLERRARYPTVSEHDVEEDFVLDFARKSKEGHCGDDSRGVE